VKSAPIAPSDSGDRCAIGLKRVDTDLTWLMQVPADSPQRLNVTVINLALPLTCSSAIGGSLVEATGMAVVVTESPTG
jgi:hypothetical protein